MSNGEFNRVLDELIKVQLDEIRDLSCMLETKFSVLRQLQEARHPHPELPLDDSPAGSAVSADFSLPVPTLGSDIRRARRSADLTQKEMAEELGVTRSYLSRLEKGRVVPSRKVVRAFRQWEASA